MRALLDWYYKNKRDLPWRKTKNPYKIWLSEIILQQTRVAQGRQYYLDFVFKYPNVNLLSKASIDEVLHLWQGLGYYSRARNMHKAAIQVIEKHNGKFPITFKELKTLPGVGDYTAAAIASIVNNECVPVVDGNVYRVLSRYYVESTPIDTVAGKKVFYKLAENSLNKEYPGDFNQALMELGAIVCTPRNPGCNLCPININCIAFKEKKQTDFPKKKGKTKVSKRYFYYFIVEDGEKVLIEKRGGGDIWNGLYQYPLIENSKRLDDEEILELLEAKDFFTSNSFTIRNISRAVKHILSHQIIQTVFIQIQVDKLYTSNNYLQVKLKDLNKYAFPRLITRFNENNNIV